MVFGYNSYNKGVTMANPNEANYQVIAQELNNEGWPEPTPEIVQNFHKKMHHNPNAIRHGGTPWEEALISELRRWQDVLAPYSD